MQLEQKEVKNARTVIEDEEAEIIRSVFKGNDSLLKSVRNLLWGLEITHEEKEIIRKTFSDKRLMSIIRKRFTPELINSPLQQAQDVWIGTEDTIIGQGRDTITQIMDSKNDAIAKTRKAIALLENPDREKIDLSYDPTKYIDDSLGINLLARNLFIKHIQTQISFLWVIANQEIKTPVEKLNDKKKDSLK